MKIYIFCLLFSLSLTSGMVKIRRSPAGVVMESEIANLTLHCEVAEEEGPVESVVWFYEGELLTQLPQQDCHQQDWDELGSGLEESGAEMEVREDIMEVNSDVMEVSEDYQIPSQPFLVAQREATDNLLEGEYSGSGEVGEEADERLCGVEADQLILHSVTRDFSGWYSCAVVTGGSLGPRAEEIQLSVEYPPENVSVSSEEILTLDEGEMFPAVFCDGDSQPPPLVSWWHRGRQVTTEATLDFTEAVTREQTGEYVCQVSNIHGLSSTSVTLDVQHRPTCELEFSVHEDELVLTCSADANPKNVRFEWQKENSTLEGQENEEKLSSEVRLRLNESLGEYTCWVSSEKGNSSCSLEVTDNAMVSGLSDRDILISIMAAAIIIPFIIFGLILYCLCRETPHHNQPEDGGSLDRKKNNVKSPLLKYDQLHADPEFYENLPFNKFRNPPKQCVSDDNLDYADCDYLDIYSNGPLKYREASEKNAKLRKKKLEDRKAVKSSYL